MTNTEDPPVSAPEDLERPLRYPRIHAARVPMPEACGCGRAVSFDLDKHEFFCIGCGCAKMCVCRHSTLTSMVRPVQVG